MSDLADKDPDEIVVTARSRSEALRNVPVQGTVIGADTIAERDLTSLEKIASAIPQLTVGRAPNGSGARITMRGIGASPTSIGIEQSVAVVVDGAYHGQGRVINEALFDLERVEVLRGPQALFFGKNATAGVISITTADPANVYGGQLRGAYEFGAAERTAEAVVSAPVGKDFSLRLAARGSGMSKGYFENRATAQPDRRFDVATSTFSTLNQPAPNVTETPAARDAVGRLTLTYAPVGRLNGSLKATGAWNDTQGGGYNNVIFSCRTGFSSLNPAVPCARDFVTYSNSMPEEIARTLPFARDGDLYNTYRSSSVTGAGSYDLDDVDLSIVINYHTNRNTWAIAGDEQSSPRPTFATENASWEAASAEVRAVGARARPLNGLIGVYTQTTRREFDQWVSFPGLADSGVADPQNTYVGLSKHSGTDGFTFSPYLQLIWRPVTRVEITAGARYTHETKSSFFFHPHVNPALATLYTPGATISADQRFSDVSPEATVTWRATQDVTVYGAYRTAYKSGGFSNSGILSALGSVEDFTFGPERAEGFEGGLKTRLLGGQLHLDLGLFDYTYNGLQIDFFNSIVFAFVTANAGAARTRGLELDFTLSPGSMRGVRFGGSLNFNDADYVEFLAPCYNGQTPAAGCRLVAGGGLPGQQLAGTPTAIAPAWTSTLGFDYHAQLSNAVEIRFGVDLRYSSDYLASGFGNPLARQPAFVVVNARAAIGATDDGWRFALLGKNLSNEFYLTSAGDGPGTGAATGTTMGQTADQIGLVAAPRTLSLELSRRF